MMRAATQSTVKFGQDEYGLVHEIGSFDGASRKDQIEALVVIPGTVLNLWFP